MNEPSEVLTFAPNYKAAAALAVVGLTLMWVGYRAIPGKLKKEREPQETFKFQIPKARTYAKPEDK